MKIPWLTTSDYMKEAFEQTFSSALNVALLTNPDIRNQLSKLTNSSSPSSGKDKDTDLFNKVREWLRTSAPPVFRTIKFDLLDTSLPTFVETMYHPIRSHVTGIFPQRADASEGEFKTLWTKLEWSDYTAILRPTDIQELPQTATRKTLPSSPTPPFFQTEAWRNEELRADFVYGPLGDARYIYELWVASPDNIDDEDAILSSLISTENGGVASKRLLLLAGPVFGIALTQARSSVLSVVIAEYIGFNRHGRRDELIPSIHSTWGDAVVVRESNQIPSARPFSPPQERLTAAQKQVADLTADGLTQGEIAHRLIKSVHTVKTLKKQVRERLGIEGGNFGEVLRSKGYGTRTR